MHVQCHTVLYTTVRTVRDLFRIKFFLIKYQVKTLILTNETSYIVVPSCKSGNYKFFGFGTEILASFSHMWTDIQLYISMTESVVMK